MRLNTRILCTCSHHGGPITYCTRNSSSGRSSKMRHTSPSVAESRRFFFGQHEALRFYVMAELSQQHRLRYGKSFPGSHVSGAQKVARHAEHDK